MIPLEYSDQRNAYRKKEGQWSGLSCLQSSQPLVAFRNLIQWRNFQDGGLNNHHLHCLEE
ncbi:unnamed protein product, partial [Musa acuminata subsp. burmannicoides]